MEYVSLGRTALMVSRTAFGALPIQRIEDRDEASSLIHAAYEGGINFFDTARSYSDSEEKLGRVFTEIRKDVIVATKSGARVASDMLKDLETSLVALHTDYVDLYQLHNPSFLPLPGGEDGLYDALLAARKAGKIRFIGITNHSFKIVTEAIDCGLYDTVQYPFSLLSSDADVALVNACAKANVGFIAMKALAGGLLTNAAAAFAWMRQFEDVVPIWGMQRKSELEEFLALEANPPVLDGAMMASIEADRVSLSGNFCRGCGYCLPCPAGIPINNANRMKQLLRRSPSAQWLTAEWRELMGRISSCTKCGLCEKRCPYGLKPYETLPGQLADYLTFVEDAKADGE